MDLAGYAAAIRLVLGTAVDASTWTDDLVEEGLRAALADLTGFWVYEATVTVAQAGYEQAVAPAGAAAVLAVRYPWYETAKWSESGERWRLIGENVIRFEQVAPAVGDAIRVRYTLLQTIEDLDGATATTVPAAAERGVIFMACSQVAEIRRRQVSENPAIPKDAAKVLGEVAERWRNLAGVWLGPAVGRAPVVAWPGLGLD